MVDDTATEVRICSGPYKGQVRRIANGLAVVGSDVASDIIILDSNLAPRHFQVRVSGDKMDLDAVGGEIDLDHHGRLLIGDGCTVHLPFRFRAGPVEIECHHCSKDNNAEPERTGFRKLLGRITSGQNRPTALALMGSLVVFPLTLDDYSAFAQLRNVKDSSRLPEMLKNDTNDGSSGDHDQNPVSPADRINAMLLESGFLDVRLKAVDGVLMFEGPVPKSERGKWSDLHKRIDREFGGRLSIVDNVSFLDAVDNELPEIEAVWFGKSPYVVVGGQRYFPGEYVDRHWRLEKIEEKEISFSLDGRVTTVRF